MNFRGQNQKIFKALVQVLEKGKKSETFSVERILEMSKCFLGAPYRAGTLETGGSERLVVNLREYDCVTFIETVAALVCLMKSGKKSFDAFRSLVQKIRYRGGRLRGYPSRLHYFSDWIHDNEKKGIVRNVTAEIGGRSFRKALNFMTTNEDFYPPLKDGINLRRMKSIERTISRRSLFFIPKKSLKRLEHRIRNGDLIAITTDIKGLDVQHVGFAARVRYRIHLLHASSLERKVVFSKKTLYRYLMQSKARSGVMVARIS